MTLGDTMSPDQKHSIMTLADTNNDGRVRALRIYIYIPLKSLLLARTHIYNRRLEREKEREIQWTDCICMYGYGYIRTRAYVHCVPCALVVSVCADQCRGVVGHGHNEARGNVKRVMTVAIEEEEKT